MTSTLFVFQGGGPTSVINATLAAVLDAAGTSYSRIVGLRHSLELVREDGLVDLTVLCGHAAKARRRLLSATPGAILGSSRARVEPHQLNALVGLMRKHGSTDLIGIGGNGTMSLLTRLAASSVEIGYPLRCIGAPKTVDNDLPGAEFSPGYGSAARFVALAVRDFDCDFRAMQTFDSVTILETMGRDTGWLAAASVLLRSSPGDAPHMVLVPERPLDEDFFLAEIDRIHQQTGRVFVVTNEVLNAVGGGLVGESSQDAPRDSLGRVMYSLGTGTGNYLAKRVRDELGLQARCLRPGNLGRAGSACVSPIDFDLAKRVGNAAVSVLARASHEPLMITVDENLGIAEAPIPGQMWSNPLPPAFFNSAGPYDITPEFAGFAKKIIGETEPIMERMFV